MIELPEAIVLARQIDQTLTGKNITHAAANTFPHAFAGYTGDPAGYNAMLAGKKICGTNPKKHPCGNVKIICGDMQLVIGTPIKYHEPGAKLPASHQLLLTLDDESHMSCTVQMWGNMFCYPVGEACRHDGFVCGKKPLPLSDEFDERYFDGLWRGVKQTLSIKAFLATEQRIPGLGNGVLQDILFNARIHPKRKLSSMSDADKERIFSSVNSTLAEMRDNGGRDTEKDLFGNTGGYKTILSSKTVKLPCRACGGGIVREAYLGGNIYFCPNCQPLL